MCYDNNKPGTKPADPPGSARRQDDKEELRMRLSTIKQNGREIAGIVTQTGIFPIEALNAAKGTAWKTELYELICAGQIPGLTAWYNACLLYTSRCV